MPDDLRATIAEVAPMLAELGYDPTAYPPQYGTPDREVVMNDAAVHDQINEKGLIGKLNIPFKEMTLRKVGGGNGKMRDLNFKRSKM